MKQVNDDLIAWWHLELLLFSQRGAGGDLSRCFKLYIMRRTKYCTKNSGNFLYHFRFRFSAFFPINYVIL